jgi:hypothetical protein
MKINFEKSGNASVDDAITLHIRAVRALINDEANYCNDVLSAMLPLATISKARYTQTLHDFCMLIIRRNDRRAMLEAREFAKIAIIKLRDYHCLSNTYTNIYYRIFEKIEALYTQKKEELI